MIIKMLENEYWYGGCVHNGLEQPFSKKTQQTINLTINSTPNQAMPFFVSTKGRYLWNETGFEISFQDGIIKISEDINLEEGHKNLKEAYLDAMSKNFSFKKITLSDDLFLNPVYNTWIELMYNQNEEDILSYARNILENGLPAGVLMIDDGWSDYYGKWSFHTGKFPNPKKMIEQLHQMGFKIMLWVCPFITPDTLEFREARKADILIKNTDGTSFLLKWWNGYSAALDFSNQEAVRWMDRQLEFLLELGVDGFKFDAGDSHFYQNENITNQLVSPNEQSRLWAEYGQKYSYNEYRVTFRAGGYSLMQRLSDKHHSWGELGILSLIPNSLIQGITGHPFSCPDMIGGGEYENFLNIKDGKLDQELFVRHSEIACLMPAMQFSAAPFRVLDKENFIKIKESISLRNQYLPFLMDSIRHAKLTGEPVIRLMTYEFPEEEVETLMDQFMIGSNLLVAPIYKKGDISRKVYVPKGSWKYNNQKLDSKGEFIEFNSNLGQPIVLEK